MHWCNTNYICWTKQRGTLWIKRWHVKTVVSLTKWMKSHTHTHNPPPPPKPLPPPLPTNVHPRSYPCLKNTLFVDSGQKKTKTPKSLILRSKKTPLIKAKTRFYSKTRFHVFFIKWNTLFFMKVRLVVSNIFLRSVFFITSNLERIFKYSSQV